MKWNHSHTMSVGAIILVIISVATTAFFFTHPFKPTYQSVTVSTRSIQETVDVSGPIVSAKSVDLSFDRGGRIVNTSVVVGQSIKAGQVLVSLENTIESGQLAQAQAALDARIVGLSSSDLAVYQSAVDAALADLNKTKADTSTSSTYAYQNAETVLRSVSVKLDDAITAADNILGIDNSLANDDIEKYLSIGNSAKLTDAQSAYHTAKNARDAARVSLQELNGTGDASKIDAALLPSVHALTDVSTLLDRTSDVLIATPPVGTLSQSLLDAKKNMISAARTSINTQASTLALAEQALTNAKNGQTDTSGSAQGLIAMKQAAYDQALANLHAKQSSPREVDLAPLRAAVEMASGVWQKTILRAPADGVVARQDAKVGGIVSPGIALVSVVNPNALQIEGMLSERDIVKVHVGDTAAVTTDAFGTDVSFPATVVSVDQSPTTNSGGSGYKVIVQFAGADARLKIGMQASVTIKTQSKDHALAVPSRSIAQKNGTSFVQLVKPDASTVETTVQTGIVSKDGFTEIVSGLKDQDRVVTFGN